MTSEKNAPTSRPGAPGLGARLAADAGFLWSRVRGRPYQLTTVLFGCPVVLGIEARREITRAYGFELEAALMQRLLDHVQPGDTVYDVGANIGLISMILALHPAGRGCRVHSFEPEPRNFAELTRNLSLNGVQDRVTPHQVALGRSEGEAVLFVRGSTGDGRHSIAETKGAKGSIRVKLSTATTFAQSSGQPPNVLKIDIEGAEGEMLAGAEGLIATGQPRDIIIEVHAKGGRDLMPDGTTIGAWLVARGYGLVWDQPRGSSVHRHYQRAGTATR